MYYGNFILVIIEKRRLLPYTSAANNEICNLIMKHWNRRVKMMGDRIHQEKIRAGHQRNVSLSRDKNIKFHIILHDQFHALEKYLFHTVIDYIKVKLVFFFAFSSLFLYKNCLNLASTHSVKERQIKWYYSCHHSNIER